MREILSGAFCVGQIPLNNERPAKCKQARYPVKDLAKRRSKMAEEKKEQEIEKKVTPVEEENEQEEIVIEPPSDEEEDTEESQEEEEKEEKEEDSFEKRYKDLQSHADKKEARYKKLLAPFEKNLVEDENGDLSFKFDDTPPKKEDIPEQATDDEWLDNPRVAAEKDYKFRRYHEKIEEKQERTKQTEAGKVEETNKAYESKRVEYWGEAQELYPDAKDKESALFKKAAEILEADPSMAASPRCDLVAIKEAAMELGITPQGKKPSPKKKSSYIIGGSSGSGGKGGDKKLSDEEFDALSSEEQNEYMKKSIE